ncbi:MAG: FAD-dependent oxidoreductase, partial [Candidatus Omnitrophica bacterium]|nr:FAD-dependent oxidoreductase [Candidatus Omnitrophota bacterium]
GADAKGVIGGVELLNDIAFDRPRHIGNKVVIIGGGNVAYDIARSALRQQQIDIAEGALHSGKDVKVSLVCLESEREMLADEVEILEGAEEGVERHNAYGPQEITVKDGAVTGVIFHKVTSIFDGSGKFNPQFDSSDVLTIEADTVLFGIGQRSDLSFIDPEKDGLVMNERGLFVMDGMTNQTSAEDVYLAGDLATGPKLMIDAIASGKKTARSIYGHLVGKSITTEIITQHSPIADFEREFGYEKIRRFESEIVEATERKASLHQVVEKGLTCHQAKIEGSRCFDCGVNTIFDGNKCILCGGCVDVCPELCLKLVPVSELDGDKNFEELTNIIKEQKGTDELTAIIKDEELCIRCSLCAIRCPTDAITMERFSFKEQIK